MADHSPLPVFTILDSTSNEVACVQLNGAGEVTRSDNGKSFYFLSAGGFRILFDQADLRKVLAIIKGLTEELDGRVIEAPKTS